jgi:hypothetical protein
LFEDHNSPLVERQAMRSLYLPCREFSGRGLTATATQRPPPFPLLRFRDIEVEWWPGKRCGPAAWCFQPERSGRGISDFCKKLLKTNFLPSCRPINEQILFSGMLAFLRC